VIKKFEELIYIKKNALDKEFCQHCIEKFKSDDRKDKGQVGAGYQPDVKRSLDLLISNLDEWSSEDEIFYKSLNKALNEYTNLEKTKLYKFNDVYFEDSGYQIQETKPGEFYTWHSDYMVNGKGWSRALTFIWYLNDIKYKGETEFITGNKIKPETGKLVIFPATWTYFHRGCPPKKETKYITTGWLYYDCQSLKA
jgi:Rps23 Pro-64 3,4-dihydroxylase Tpa1-like proline 4-hydroxylase